MQEAQAGMVPAHSSPNQKQCRSIVWYHTIKYWTGHSKNSPFQPKRHVSNWYQMAKVDFFCIILWFILFYFLLWISPTKRALTLGRSRLFIGLYISQSYWVRTEKCKNDVVLHFMLVGGSNPLYSNKANLCFLCAWLTNPTISHISVAFMLCMTFHL